MITDTFKIRPRYGEVDQMGYVYHANYVSYCHQARTELLRKLDLHDALLEERGVMLPVISFDISYKKPVRYDEELTIKTIISELPKVRMHFQFEIVNANGELTTTASSTVVFANSISRLPIAMPVFIHGVLSPYFKKCLVND